MPTPAYLYVADVTRCNTTQKLDWEASAYFFFGLFWRRDCFCILRLTLPFAFVEPELNPRHPFTEALATSENGFLGYFLGT